MHELSLVETMLAQTKRHAQGKPVKQITLTVGVLTCVDPEAMQFCFQATRDDVGLGQTALCIERQPAWGHCRRCGAEFKVREAIQPCACGSLDIALEGGEDILIKELEFC